MIKVIHDIDRQEDTLIFRKNSLALFAVWNQFDVDEDAEVGSKLRNASAISYMIKKR